MEEKKEVLREVETVKAVDWGVCNMFALVAQAFWVPTPRSGSKIRGTVSSDYGKPV
jgi:hypothetical protein